MVANHSENWRQAVESHTLCSEATAHAYWDVTPRYFKGFEEHLRLKVFYLYFENFGGAPLSFLKPQLRVKATAS